ncbi:MAG: helix-turn-helix domain-containing protein [Solirubrobacteraceae bacterium]
MEAGRREITGEAESVDVEASQPASDDARPRTKAAQSEATTTALIKAARELFAQQGYAGVGTEEIVRRAGVTRGALYHHFRAGKEELFKAVLVQVSAEVVQRVARAAAATDDPWEELVLGSEAFLDACATPEVQRIVLLDAPSVLDWDVRRAIDADYGLRLLEGALQNAMDAGRIIPGSASAMAQVLAGALDEAAMVVAQADDPKAARVEMSHTVRRLLEGLRTPAA